MADHKIAEPSVSYNVVADRDNQGRFLPGTVYGTQRKTMEAALRRTVHQSPQKLRNACERLLDIAANDPEPRNSIAAFSLIADRLDGKAIARIETSEGAPSDLGLADLVALVLNARKHDATDAPQPTAEPALERPEEWGVGDIGVK